MTKGRNRHGQEEETKGQGSAEIPFREEQEEGQGAHPRTGIGIRIRGESRGRQASDMIESRQLFRRGSLRTFAYDEAYVLFLIVSTDR